MRSGSEAFGEWEMPGPAMRCWVLMAHQSRANVEKLVLLKYSEFLAYTSTYLLLDHRNLNGFHPPVYLGWENASLG